MKTHDPDLVTLQEGARLCGATPQNWSKMDRRGTLPVRPVIVGRSVVLYRLSELTLWWTNRQK